MQSPLVPWARAGRKFGVGCQAVIPQVLPVTSRLAVLVLGGSSSPVGLPKLFRVSPDIYYIFAWAFFFFQLRKSLDAVREGWEGRCSVAGCPVWYLRPPALSPVVLATSKPAGAPVPSSPSRGTASRFPGFILAGRSMEADGTRSSGCCVPQWPNSLAAPWNLLLLWLVMWVPWFMHLYELCCTSEWEFCIHIYCLFSCVPYQMALLTVSQ